MGWLSNETIFYGGIIIAAFSLILATICFFILKIKKIKLDARLDAEYGEKLKGRK